MLRGCREREQRVSAHVVLAPTRSGCAAHRRRIRRTQRGARSLSRSVLTSWWPLLDDARQQQFVSVQHDSSGLFMHRRLQFCHRCLHSRWSVSPTSFCLVLALYDCVVYQRCSNYVT
eukprot:5184306-Pleurochrysis_carterae.AAC.1